MQFLPGNTIQEMPQTQMSTMTLHCAVSHSQAKSGDIFASRKYFSFHT